MSHPRASARASGAACLLLTLAVMPVVSSASPAGRQSAPLRPSGTPGADGIWAELGPPHFAGARAIYGPSHQRMLLFGGRYLDRDSLSSDVWDATIRSSLARVASSRLA